MKNIKKMNRYFTYKTLQVDKTLKVDKTLLEKLMNIFLGVNIQI